MTGENKFQKKFCNNSCAAKYNNRKRVISEEQKEKVSNSLRKHFAEKYNDTIENRYNGIERIKTGEKSKKASYKCVCVVCGKEFHSTRKDTTHCSPKCSAADPNVKQKLKSKVQERIDNGTFSG